MYVDSARSLLPHMLFFPFGIGKKEHSPPAHYNETGTANNSNMKSYTKRRQNTTMHNIVILGTVAYFI